MISGLWICSKVSLLVGFPLYFELSLSPPQPETFQSSLKEWMSYAMNQESINTFKMHFEIQLYSLSWFVLLMSRPTQNLRPQKLDCLSFVMLHTFLLHVYLLNISPNLIMLFATNISMQFPQLCSTHLINLNPFCKIFPKNQCRQFSFNCSFTTFGHINV